MHSLYGKYVLKSLKETKIEQGVGKVETCISITKCFCSQFYLLLCIGFLWPLTIQKDEIV